jgi:hypothetical protein
MPLQAIATKLVPREAMSRRRVVPNPARRDAISRAVTDAGASRAGGFSPGLMELTVAKFGLLPADASRGQRFGLKFSNAAGRAGLRKLPAGNKIPRFVKSDIDAQNFLCA